MKCTKKDMGSGVPIMGEQGWFLFLCSLACIIFKGSVGLILSKASVMRVSIPLDL